MAQIFRIFVPTIDENTKSIELIEDEHHILSRVLRMAEGDSIEVLNGKGLRAQCKIQKMNRNSSELQIVNAAIEPNELPKVLLYVASLKGEKLHLIIQKATELGVAKLGIFNADHSVAIKSFPRSEKLEAVAIEAIRQSGNPFLPEIVFFEDTDSIPFDYEDDTINWVLDEQTETLGLEQPLTKFAQVRIFVGPEGGFSPREKTLFIERNCKLLRIAPYVLRSETAAISAVAICKALWRRKE